MAFTAPIPSEIRNHGAAYACKNDFGDLIAALCNKRCRGHQCRKGRQRHSALGQQDVDENDQQAMLFNDGNDVLHRFSAPRGRSA